MQPVDRGTDELFRDNAQRMNRTCINCKPRVGYPNEQLKVRSPEITDEISTAATRCLCALDDCLTVIPIDTCGSAVFKHVLDVGLCPLYIPINVYDEPRSFWDGEPKIKSDGAGYAAQSNENAPAVVHMLRLIKVVRDDGVFVRKDHHERNTGGG
jgi:hypothetical protein